MRFIFSFVVMLNVTLCASQAMGADTLPTTVKLRDGVISGSGSPVRSYKGVPYAAPPVSDLRWKPPQRPAHWNGVRSGFDFAPDCMQQPDRRLRAKTMSEDCLYANVWTPAIHAGDKLPVIVFIYGGSFDHGSGSRFDYDGEKLAAKGVVFVNFNYRMGAFGFLASRELAQESGAHSSGNYALLDQIAALHWVHDNIRAFGGDPARVTIMGQSAGGSSVNLLLLSPLAKGLFRSAISESPGNLRNMATLDAAEQAWVPFGSNLASMRSMTAEAVMARFNEIRRQSAQSSSVRIGGPIIDGWIVPASEREAYETGHVNLVPLIIGNVTNEAGVAVDKTPAQTVALYTDYMQKHFGSFAGRLLQVYPVTQDADAASAVVAVSTDTQHGFEARTVASAMAKINPSVYRYYFSRHRNDGRTSPSHFDDIAYVFGHLGTSTLQGDPSGGVSAADEAAYNKKDVQLSDVIMDTFVRFAATANPNGPGLPSWPSYSQGTYLEFGDRIYTLPDTHKDQIEVLQEYFNSVEMRSKPKS